MPQTPINHLKQENHLNDTQGGVRSGTQALLACCTLFYFCD